MNEQEVVTLMASSNCADQWDRNCHTVKAACGGNYPPFWFSLVIASGLLERTSATWADPGPGDRIEVMLH